MAADMEQMDIMSNVGVVLDMMSKWSDEVSTVKFTHSLGLINISRDRLGKLETARSEELDKQRSATSKLHDEQKTLKEELDKQKAITAKLEADQKASMTEHNTKLESLARWESSQNKRATEQESLGKQLATAKEDVDNEKLTVLEALKDNTSSVAGGLGKLQSTLTDVEKQKGIVEQRTKDLDIEARRLQTIKAELDEAQTMHTESKAEYDWKLATIKRKETDVTRDKINYEQLLKAVQDRETAVTNKETECTEVEKQVIASMDRHAVLSTQLAAQKTEQEKRQAQLDSRDEKTRIAEGSVEGEREKLARDRGNLADMSKLIADFKKMSVNVSNSLAKVPSENNINEVLVKLQKSEDDLKETQNARHATETSLRKELAELDRTNKGLEAKVKVITAERDTATLTTSEVNVCLDAARSQGSIAETQLRTANMSNEVLQEQINTLQTNLHIAEYSGLMTKIAWEAANEALQQQIADLEIRLESARSTAQDAVDQGFMTKTTLEAANTELQNTIDGTKDDMKAAEAARDTAKDQLHKNKTESDATNKDLQDQVDNLTKELDMANSVGNTERDKSATLKTEHEAANQKLQARNTNLEMKLKSANDSRNTAVDDRLELKTQLDAAKADTDSKIATLNQQNQELNSQVKTAEIQAQNGRTAQGRLESEISTLKGQNQQLTSQVKTADIQAETVRTAQGHLDSEVSTLKQQNQQLTSRVKITETQAQTARTAQEQLSSANATLEQKNQQLTAQANADQTSNRQLSEQNTKLLADKVSIQTQNIDLVAENESLTRDKSDMQGQVKEVNRRKHNAEREATQGKEKAEALQKTIDNLELAVNITATQTTSSSTPPSSTSDKWLKSLDDYRKCLSKFNIRFEGNLQPPVLIWQLATVFAGPRQREIFEAFINRRPWIQDDGYYCIQQVMTEEFDDQPVPADGKCKDEHFEEQGVCIQMRIHWHDDNVLLFCRQVEDSQMLAGDKNR